MKIRIISYLALTAAAGYAQWTGSGYNAAKNDGAIVIAANDPRVVTGVFTWNPARDGWDADGDNVYHFASFRIDPGVRVRVRADRMRRPGPLVMLVQGAVEIRGTLDVSGNDGAGCTDTSSRAPTVPGPGGFPGGAGGTGGGPGQRGFGPGSAAYVSIGPGSGLGPGTFQCPANHSGAFLLPISGLTLPCGNGTYGNSYLTPLIGGSGGAGTSNMASGGAGGGAIRISSDTSITVGIANSLDGAIEARGGGVERCLLGGSVYWYGGLGSGGAIHLQAPTVINGVNTSQGLNTSGGSMNVGNAFIGTASAGRVRIDSTTLGGVGFVVPSMVAGPLVNVALPANPVVLISSIDGVPVSASPTGSYLVPDVVINKTTAVPVVVASQNIPPGTAINLNISSDTPGADSVVAATIGGTLENGTVTVSVTFPIGVQRIYVRATW